MPVMSAIFETGTPDFPETFTPARHNTSVSVEILCHETGPTSAPCPVLPQHGHQ